MSTLSRRRLRPWLMFVGPEVDGGDSLTPEQFLEKHGYPKDTATDDMTDAQRAAYWRSKSKGFQKDAENKGRELARWTALGEFDAVSTTIQTAEQQRQAALTDAQRAQEEAQRAEQAARAAGEAAARSKFLGTAVESQIIALTIAPGEKPEDAAARVKNALQFVDVNRFVDDNGDLSTDLVQQYAQSIAPTDSAGTGGDPLSALMSRQTTPPPGSGGSIAEARERTRERLTKKK